MTRSGLIASALLSVLSFRAGGQTDSIRPLAPVLDFVTVNQPTGNVEIFWQPSSSPDVAGYVIYLYNNNEGYVLDTLKSPDATYYLRTGSGTSYYSESFVVAALDTAGNISPLSNSLNTIYAETEIDSCNKKLVIKWNSYKSNPVRVSKYLILVSADGSQFSVAGEVSPETNTLIIDDFESDTRYCFIVRALLDNEKVSGSNSDCLVTKMERPPEWINADYATVNNDNKIELSFHIDPLSEIKIFRLERKTGKTGNFSQIAQFTISTPSISYIDNNADISEINYYRLAALNNCGIPVTWSNPSANIVLACDQNGDEIRLAWNSYRGWTGGISSYKLFTNTGDGFKEIETISPDDTLFIIKYSDIMYDVTGNEVCFMVKASEVSNPYTDPGESSSPAVCIPASVVITVPDIFTPDGNGINDLFSPVLSFTPDEYYLLITDLRRRKVFESRNFNNKWDGRVNGSSLPGGVYLWLLETRVPGGEKITRSGTVTIVFNR